MALLPSHCIYVSENRGCSLWHWLKLLNSSEGWFVWWSWCCLDVLNASRACVHPQACVFDELLAGYGATCSGASWQIDLSLTLTPQAFVTSQEKKYERNQSTNKLRKKKPERLWILTESLYALCDKKICIVITDKWWCFYLVVHFCEICKM